MKSQPRIFQHLARINAPSAGLLLALLLAVDLAFIVIHIIHNATPLLSSYLYNIESDGGYSELFQYIKFLWLVLLFAALLLVTKCWSYVGWIMVFGYFLLDDSIEIHERLGRHVAKLFDFTPPFNLRLQDFGELAVSAAVGLGLLVALTWSYLRGSRLFRKISVDMVLLVGVLVFFAAFVDMAHNAIKLGKAVYVGLGLLEDGGEMIVVSVMLWYVFSLASRRGNATAFLHELVPTALTPAGIARKLHMPLPALFRLDDGPSTLRSET